MGYVLMVSSTLLNPILLPPVLLSGFSELYLMFVHLCMCSQYPLLVSKVSFIDLVLV